MTAAQPPTRTGRIIERVRAIPEGYVRTYGDIDPRAPRLVGRILSHTHDIPWHRVVRADGTLPQGEAQRKLLDAEGVPLLGNRVDLTEARLPPEL
jgi:methylated-DNA-protein-cysteine methyltransferase-like protein